MSDVIRNHAIEHIWCNPTQDKQSIIQPVLVSFVRGRYQNIEMDRTPLKTPTRENYYVYRIGHYPPTVRGIYSSLKEWTPLTKVATANRCLFMVYDDDGFVLPASTTYIRMLDNKTVILAVLENKAFNLESAPIYLRHYSNAFFESVRSNGRRELWIDGIRRGEEQDAALIALMEREAGLKQVGFKYFVVHNGVIKDSIIPSEIRVGELVDLYCDASIESVHQFRTDDLIYYHSKQQATRRYIVDLGNADSILYHDDIDIRVGQYDENGVLKLKRYFHRNRPANVMMLTPSTYSIDVNQVELQSLGYDPARVGIEFIVRKSGYERELTFETNRLHELRKLPPELRTKILTTGFVAKDLWDPNTLETSSYSRLMRVPSIDQNLTTDLYRCYGYNALSLYFAENLRHTYEEQGRTVVDVPVVYYTGSYIAYDRDGLILAKGAVGNEIRLYLHEDVYYVEFMQGQLSATNRDLMGVDGMSFKQGTKYRLYRRPTGTQFWTDITDNVSWNIVGDRIVHNFSSERHDWIMRSDDWFFFKEQTLDDYRGILEVVMQDNGGTMELPFGNITVRLNDKELVQNVDYFLLHQRIFIVNRRFRKAVQNKVTVIASGFPEQTDQGTVDWGQPDSVGWVINGLLSRDDVYHVRDDRLFRLTVGGDLKMRDQVQWFEDDYTAVGDMVNGQPYSLTHKTPLLTEIGIDDQTCRELMTTASEVNQRVSDFLTLHYPPPSDMVVNAIDEHWEITSIFTARILDDILNNVFLIPEGRILDSDFDELLKNYLYLLPIDPAYHGVNGALEQGFVTIRPHVQETQIAVSERVYTFIDRVATYYLKGKVDMTGHLVITLQV